MRASAHLLPLAALLVAAPATADDVESAGYGADLYLTGRSVELTHRDGMASVKVRYQVVNPARYADQARVSLILPSRGQLVGLRQRFAGAWSTGRLLDAAVASDRYVAYLDAPYRGPRSAALLSRDGGAPALSLSFIPAGGRVDVAYEVAVPTCYHRGRWYLTVPPVDAPRAVRAPGATVVAADDLSAAIRDELTAACERAGLPDGFLDDDLVVSWPEPTRVGATARAIAVGAAADAPRAIEVWIAPKLAAAPQRPAVVFVLDGSKSIGPDGLAAQLAIVRGYLAHQRDARVELIVARRHASRLFGELLDVEGALARLDALGTSLPLGNGSHLDRGLALGAALLAATPGPRRLIAFTDDLLRPALTDDAVGAALAALPPDAVVHLIEPSLGPAEVRSDRDHHLADPIAPWGGLMAAVSAEPAPRAAHAPLLELIRPIRIEAIAIGDEVIADELREGESLRHVDRSQAPVTAWVWGRRLPIAQPSDPASLTQAARLVLATQHDLTEDETRALAKHAHAVTEFTSLLAERPNTEPGGLPPIDRGIAAYSHWTSSCGPHVAITGNHTIGVGVGHPGPRREPPDLTPLLAQAIAACAASEPAPWAVEIAIDTTGIEIVDVEVATGSPGLARCATEAAWQLDLPGEFAPFTRRFSARFAGP
jgi:hypothetical protein